MVITAHSREGLGKQKGDLGVKGAIEGRRVAAQQLPTHPLLHS